jgi:hypothetical protein
MISLPKSVILNKKSTRSAIIIGIFSICYYFYPVLFFTYDQGPDNSFDYPIIYFSLNIYHSMSIAGRGFAIVVQLVCCIISWLLLWGLLALIFSTIKKRGINKN